MKNIVDKIVNFLKIKVDLYKENVKCKNRIKEQKESYNYFKSDPMSRLCCYASMEHEYRVLMNRMGVEFDYHEISEFIQRYDFKKKNKTEFDISVEWLILIGWCNKYTSNFGWCNIEFLILFNVAEPHVLDDEEVKKYIKNWWL